MSWNGPRFDPHSHVITHLELGYHCRHCEPLTPGSHNSPQWSSPGGPVCHSSACLLCGLVYGWSRDADRAPGMASAPGPGNSQPCTTSSFSPTSQKTTSVPAGEQRARSHATLSTSMNLCATTTQTLSSKMRRTPMQTASWLRWDCDVMVSQVQLSLVELNDSSGHLFPFTLVISDDCAVSIMKPTDTAKNQLQIDRRMLSLVSLEPFQDNPFAGWLINCVYSSYSANPACHFHIKSYNLIHCLLYSKPYLPLPGSLPGS